MPLWPIIPAVYAALVAWLAWEIRRAPVIEDEMDSDIDIIIDHDRHEVRVSADDRTTRFYMEPGFELSGVTVDFTGPRVEFRKVEAAEVR